MKRYCFSLKSDFSPGIKHLIWCVVSTPAGNLFQSLDLKKEAVLQVFVGVWSSKNSRAYWSKGSTWGTLWQYIKVSSTAVAARFMGKLGFEKEKIYMQNKTKKTCRNFEHDFFVTTRCSDWFYNLRGFIHFFSLSSSPLRVTTCLWQAAGCSAKIILK